MIRVEQNQIVLKKKITLNYYSIGNPEIGSLSKNNKSLHTLVFLHGLTNEAQTWKTLFPFFNREDFYCLFIDLPGHGQSAKERYSYDIDFYADILHQFTETLQLEKFSLIGHSLGGQTAIYFALHYPYLVDKISLIATSGFETFSFMESVMMQRAVAFPTMLSRYLTLLRPTLTQNNYIPVDEILESPELLDVVSKSMIGMLKYPVFSDLSELQMPIQVIFGENDMAIPNAILHPNLTTADVAAAGAKQIKNSQLELISHAGHFVHLQYPELVARKIIGFLI